MKLQQFIDKMKLENKLEEFYKDLGKSVTELVQKYENENISVDETSANVTIVTGLWDMGRGDISDSFKRPYSQYKERFAELLKAPVNMFIYASKDDEEFIWQHRSRHNTFLKLIELSEFETWFSFYNEVQSIRTDDKWKSQAAWLMESPQATLPYYNPVVMSKVFMVNDASLLNPFGNDYFFWIDAGITNTVDSGYFTHDKVFDNLPVVMENDGRNVVFLSYEYEGNDEIHGFPRKQIKKFTNTIDPKYVCRGGFFGGSRSGIEKLNSAYHGILSTTLSQGLMGTEESIFTIISYQMPTEILRYEIGSDGLVWPFFEDLKEPSKIKEKLPPPALSLKTAKNILYVLTFNSPTQFKSICESMQNADPDLMNISRKVLINNSTDKDTFEEYDTLCEEYGFEEIHQENLGVCGGRQFAAEHFEESDADFYMFFEDDMHINSVDLSNELCKNGFTRYVSSLYKTVLGIMIKEKFDFLKFSFTEFYGSNNEQWSWYNVPQDIRTRDWPDYDQLPITGIDSNVPKTIFKNINVFLNTAYATGEIYYSNWPQIVSREGNRKMFIETKWENPFEQTWMSHIYQLTKDNQVRSAVLLASPVTHDRFEFYDGKLRKES